MKFIKITAAISFALFAVLLSVASAQPHEGESLEKVSAVVGSEVILKSDVDGQISMLQQQDPSAKMDDPALRKRVLDLLIAEKLILIKAYEDSVEVTDEEVQQRWDYQLAQLVKRYGSESRIEAIYGTSIAKIQNDYREDIRKMLMTEKIRRNTFSKITISPREVEEFYAQYKDSIPMVPTRVDLYHIVKNVQASRSSKERVYELAMLVRDSIIKGGDFAAFAKSHSADVSNSSNGGDLGWIEKGKLVKEFEQAAFNLQIGQISLPIETPFGFHIIQTLNKNKDSVYTRHILFRTGQNTEERDSAKAFLANLKKRVAAGENFEDLARKYSDEKESQGFGGALGKYPVDMIPGNIREEIDKIAVGGVSDPSQFNAEPQMSFHIIYKKRIIESHKANLTDDLKEIQQYATQRKQQKLYNDWVEELRKTIYWEIKE